MRKRKKKNTLKTRENLKTKFVDLKKGHAPNYFSDGNINSNKKK